MFIVWVMEAGLLVIALASFVIVLAIAIPLEVLLVPIWILFPGLRYPILGWSAWASHWFGVYIRWVCGVEPDEDEDAT